MKVAILAGGFGTRLMEKTSVIPKPMVEIGGKPILWHIMKIFSHYGFNEFVIALGYKGDIIKDYFLQYHYHRHSLSINLQTNEIVTHNGKDDPWMIHLLDTGINTLTGGRLKQVIDFIGNETFLMTYGDGVANINIESLVKTHKYSKKFATITAIHPPSRYGEIAIDNNLAVNFMEKPQISGGWINGGFFVLEPEVSNYIAHNQISWENEPINDLVREKQLSVFTHEGYWQCMDSLRDVKILEELWQNGNAPWKIW